MSTALASDKSASYDKYQAEDDLRTITSAKKIMADPARMKHVQRAAKEKLGEMEHMKKIAAGQI